MISGFLGEEDAISFEIELFGRKWLRDRRLVIDFRAGELSLG